MDLPSSRERREGRSDAAFPPRIVHSPLLHIRRTSWHLWTLEHGRGGPQDNNKDRPPPDDLRELAMLMSLTLPVSYAGWLEVRVAC